MELVIGYKKSKTDRDYIKKSSFVLEFGKKEKAANVKRVLKEIKYDYVGFISDKYYFEPEASGFCCILNGNSVFTNGFGKESKIEPLVFVDGLIRRCIVKRLTITNENNEYVIESPKASKDKNSCVTGRKFTHTTADPFPISDPDETYTCTYSLDEPVLLFTFQDSQRDRFINQAFYKGCAPFFFVLSGRNGSMNRISGEKMEVVEGLGSLWNTYYCVYEDISELTFEFEYDYKSEIMIDDRTIPLLKGQFEFIRHEYLYEDDEYDSESYTSKRCVKGIFWGCNERIDMREDHPERDMFQILGLNPLIVTESGEDQYAESVLFTDLEKWIRERVCDIKELDRGFREDICYQLNEQLKEYGLCLNADQKYLDKAESDKLPEIPYNSFTIDQSNRLIRWCYDRYKDYYYHDVSKDEIEKVMSAAGRKKGSDKVLGDKQKEKLVKMIIDQKEELKDTETGSLTQYIRDEYGGRQETKSGYSVAVHEIGHALAGFTQTGCANGGQKVSVIKGEDYGGISNVGYVNRGNKIEFIEDQIRICLASRASEEMFFGNSSKGWSQDYRSAAELIIYAIMIFGEIYYYEGDFVCRLSGARPVYRLESVIDRLIEYYMDQTRALLLGKKELIRELACALLKKGELNGEEFKNLYNGYYEKKEAQDLCDRIRCAFDSVRDESWDDEASIKLVKELFGSKNGKNHIWKRTNTKKYDDCKARVRMKDILGFDLFSIDWREQMGKEFSNLSDEVIRQGGPCLITGKIGHYAVFIDHSDRNGDRSMPQKAYSTDPKLTYDNLEYTNAVYSK